MEPLNMLEIVFITLGLIAIVFGSLIGLGALMGRMNDEDEHGRGL